MSEISMIYPIDWHGLEDFSEYIFDKTGLPQVNYGDEIGLKYNPITISQYGLYHFSVREKLDYQQSTQLALLCADWLVDNVQGWHHGAAAWILDFKLPLYGPKPPWISGMAQGEAVSLLVRAFIETKDRKYLDLAENAMIPFQYSTAENGVVDYVDEHRPVIQEYPALPAPHVLNGFIFGLIGVYEYALYMENQYYLDFANDCKDTLLDHFKSWDLGYWTRYDLYKVKRPASTMYHELHIRQMYALAILFNEKRFTEIGDRWRHMQNRFGNRLLKMIFKVYEKAVLHFGGLY